MITISINSGVAASKKKDFKSVVEDVMNALTLAKGRNRSLLYR